MSMAQAVACVAWLLHQPVPEGVPEIVYTSAISEVATAHGMPWTTRALTSGNVIYLDEKTMRNDLAHELTHWVLRSNGVEYDWREENKARFVSRKFDTWCGQ